MPIAVELVISCGYALEVDHAHRFMKLGPVTAHLCGPGFFAVKVRVDEAAHSLLHRQYKHEFYRQPDIADTYLEVFKCVIVFLPLLNNKLQAR